MSTRTLIALGSLIALGAACARANDNSSPEGDGGSDDETTSGPTVGSGPSSGSGSSSGTGGAGSSTSSTGGSEGGAGGGTTTGAGGSTNNCLHDTCTEGPALTIGCGDPCVDTVCNDDSFCCDMGGGEWDSICVESAVNLCGAVCMLPPGYGDLVITEIMNNPAAVLDTAGEWLEIYNATSAAIDLQGMSLRHQDWSVNPNAVEPITGSVVVPPGGYVVLGINGNTGTNGNVAVDYVYGSTVNLANDDDYLAIEDANQNVIDEVYYDELSGLDPNGKSRSLNPLYLNGYDNDDDTYFCEASTTMGGGTDLGTPKAGNDSCPP